MAAGSPSGTIYSSLISWDAVACQFNNFVLRSGVYFPGLFHASKSMATR